MLYVGSRSLLSLNGLSGACGEVILRDVSFERRKDRNVRTKRKSQTHLWLVVALATTTPTTSATSTTTATTASPRSSAASTEIHRRRHLKEGKVKFEVGRRVGRRVGAVFVRRLEFPSDIEETRRKEAQSEALILKKGVNHR